MSEPTEFQLLQQIRALINSLGPRHTVEDAAVALNKIHRLVPEDKYAPLVSWDVAFTFSLKRMATSEGQATRMAALSLADELIHRHNPVNSRVDGYNALVDYILEQGVEVRRS